MLASFANLALTILRLGKATIIRQCMRNRLLKSKRAVKILHNGRPMGALATACGHCGATPSPAWGGTASSARPEGTEKVRSVRARRYNPPRPVRELSVDHFRAPIKSSTEARPDSMVMRFGCRTELRNCLSLIALHLSAGAVMIVMFWACVRKTPASGIQLGLSPRPFHR